MTPPVTLVRQHDTHRLIPSRYLVHALRGILLKGNGLDVLWPDLLALAIFATVIVGLATARFQRRIA